QISSVRSYGDPIHHIGRRGAIWIEIRKINDVPDISGLRVDLDDPVRLIDVRENVTVDVLQFIQLIQWCSVIANMHNTLYRKGRWRYEPKRIGSITHDQ